MSPSRRWVAAQVEPLHPTKCPNCMNQPVSKRFLKIELLLQGNLAVFCA
jgi:hypothetical protein